ncbi:hypothetical protein DFH08DRAFT_817554 [Mycena albidolilacea]|uniref:Uncharacterized protein n=1 Tax=Mycena albidolilacea TaxID=1033008 RepID=A0AAD6ZHS4_9AGAR|nr:hypothetical protein DFH08DRAFT_817554 [Mycena albidolilacea]
MSKEKDAEKVLGVNNLSSGGKMTAGITGKPRLKPKPSPPGWLGLGFEESETKARGFQAQAGASKPKPGLPSQVKLSLPMQSELPSAKGTGHKACLYNTSNFKISESRPLGSTSATPRVTETLQISRIGISCPNPVKITVSVKTLSTKQVEAGPEEGEASKDASASIHISPPWQVIHPYDTISALTSNARVLDSHKSLVVVFKKMVFKRTLFRKTKKFPFERLLGYCSQNSIPTVYELYEKEGVVITAEMQTEIQTNAVQVESVDSKDSVISNLSSALSIVQQVGKMIESFPFIEPIGAILSEFVKVYKEVNDNHAKRDALMEKYAGLAREIGEAFLRLKERDYLSQASRLAWDLKRYMELLKGVRSMILVFDDRGASLRFIQRGELGAQMDKFDKDLESFGTRFRTNRLVDIEIEQSKAARYPKNLPLWKNETSADIKSYVSEQFSSNGRLKEWASKDRVNKIVKKSAGMFRLAFCMLQQLQECDLDGDFDEILDVLPNDLHGIYARSLRSVDSQYSPHIRKLLRWLLFSERPPTVAQLRDALAFDFPNPESYVFDRHRSPKPGAFEKWLAGLISITPPSSVKKDRTNGSTDDSPGDDCTRTTGVIALWMFCVGEGAAHSIADEAHCLLAQTCISYLLHFADHDPATPRLFEYAAEFGLVHLVRCQSGERSSMLAFSLKLLEDGSPHYLVFKDEWRRVHRLPSTITRPSFTWVPIWGPEKSGEGCPWIGEQRIHACSKKGPHKMVELLIYHGANPKGVRALCAALQGGHEQIVQLLINADSDVNKQCRHGAVLAHAVAKNSVSLTRMLLVRGAKPEPKKTRSTLYIALMRENEEIIRLLMEAKADVNGFAEDRISKISVLARAVKNNSLSQTKMLLEAGAKVDLEVLALARLGDSAVRQLLYEESGEGRKKVDLDESDESDDSMPELRSIVVSDLSSLTSDSFYSSSPSDDFEE